MGCPEGIGGGARGMGAAFIRQLQGIVDSDLVDEDAKLDLVADYGSDQTVSHHGKWSRLSSKSDHQRSAKIRQAFAEALGNVAGHAERTGSAGNKKLDEIIDRLTDTTKPLTKREVKMVLDKAKSFVDDFERKAQDSKIKSKLPDETKSSKVEEQKTLDKPKLGNAEVKDAKPTRPVDVINGEIEALRGTIDNQIKQINTLFSFDDSFDKRRQIMEKSLDMLQKQLEELKAELKEAEAKPPKVANSENQIAATNVGNVNKPPVKYVFQEGKGIAFDNGEFHISGKWLQEKQKNGMRGDVYKAIVNDIFDKLKGFGNWLNGECKAKIISDNKIDGLAKTYFDKRWDLKNGDQLKDPLLKVLSEACKSDESFSIDKMKELVRKAVENKLREEGVLSFGPAEARLKEMTEGNDNQALVKLRNDFDVWKKTELESVKTIIGENACKAFETDFIDKTYALLEKVVKDKSLKSLAFSTKDGEKTIFNHLVSFLADGTDGKKPLFDAIKQDLATALGNYRLVDEGAKNIKPKLTMPSQDQDPRIKQDRETSPKDIVENLLNQKSPVGLVQKGSLSCWMISVVNGLLATEKGRKILQTSFSNSDECVFNARTVNGETQEIKVSSAEIKDVMAKSKKGKEVSQLEAAIWLGVDKMTKRKDLFDVKGCDLGAMGEATDVATLFGLRNAETSVGRTDTDDNYFWVTGANALRQGKVVVVHARSGDSIQSGHFVTAIGTKFVGTAKDNAPEKSFLIQDSLESWKTQTLKSDELNVSGSNKKQTRYAVLAFELP